MMAPSFANLNQLKPLTEEQHVLLFEYATGIPRETGLITHVRLGLRPAMQQASRYRVCERLVSRVSVHMPGCLV